MPRVLGLVLKAWQFRVVSPRRCICKKIPWPNKISELDREIPSSSHRRGPWQKGKGHNSCTERKTGECFQRETIGSCSRRDDCSFLHTHATGRRETMWKKVGDAGKTHLEQASSSVPKVKEQTDVKSSNSLKARVKKKPCLWLTRWKKPSCNYQHHPVCRNCKSGIRCICGIRC